MENGIKLFRDSDGNLKQMLSFAEGISFRESPLDFFILLARYKFAIRFLKKSDSVLDAGCGHGFGSVFLSKFAGSVIGTDYDSDLIKANKEQYKDINNLKFQELNLLDISSHKSIYDVVISMDVIEHFTKQQTEIVSLNYSKLTKDGGFAVIGTPNKISQPYASKRRADTHIYEFEPAEFEKMLSKYFKRVFLFSMTDEIVSTSFPDLAWYLMALCIK